MSETDNSSARTSLEEERTDIERRLESLTADGASAPDFDENFADSGQVAAEQGENLSLAAALKDQLEDVEAALAHLDDGSYGVCEECGSAIDAARLEAMPSARLCMKHA